MPVEDMVDAALVGLDQGELVTIPGLHNATSGHAVATPNTVHLGSVLYSNCARKLSLIAWDVTAKEK